MSSNQYIIDLELKNLLKIQIFWIGVEPKQPHSVRHHESGTTHFALNRHRMLPETCFVCFLKQVNLVKKMQHCIVNSLYY